jgi:putative intracellular protease/amidase
MVDLLQDPDLGEVLRPAHSTAKTTALLCHGPVAISSGLIESKDNVCNFVVKFFDKNTFRQFQRSLGGGSDMRLKWASLV